MCSCIVYDGHNPIDPKIRMGLHLCSFCAYRMTRMRSCAHSNPLKHFSSHRPALGIIGRPSRRCYNVQCRCLVVWLWCQHGHGGSPEQEEGEGVGTLPGGFERLQVGFQHARTVWFFPEYRNLFQTTFWHCKRKLYGTQIGGRLTTMTNKSFG